MRNIFKLIIFIIILNLLKPFSIKGAEISPYSSDLIHNYTASIESSNNNILTIKYLIFAKGKADEIGASKIIIQQKSGTSWTNVKIYTSNNTSNLIAYNSIIKDGNLTYNGGKGNEYRAVVTLYVKSGNIIDTRIVTTSKVIL